jgi:peptide deformylase
VVAGHAAQPRSIKTYDDPVLNTSAAAIVDIQSPAVQQLIDDLIATAVDRNGVGIAAPQVGESLQLMIVASRPTPRYPQAPEMSPMAMINPRLLQVSEAMDKDWEGCLSVPGIRGAVSRHRVIEVAYYDRDGNQHQRVFDGFIARIFQHEYDHFHGVVFLDRVESEADLISEADYQAMVNPDALAG